MDILRVLSKADLEVRKKILELVLDLVNLRNIDEVWFYTVASYMFSLVAMVSSSFPPSFSSSPQVVMVLKKEVTATSSPEETVAADDLANYRLSLVKTLHACSIRFSTVAPSAVPLVSLSLPTVATACIELHSSLLIPEGGVE